MQILYTDVLIVGGGGAACRAAIEASDAGGEVMLLTKGLLGSGATGFPACEMGGFNVPDGAISPDDSAQFFFEDILRAGDGMADTRLAAILAQNAERIFRSLEDWGFSCKNAQGKYEVFQGCFSSLARTHVIEGHGKAIIQTLVRQLRTRPVRIFENHMAVRLLVHDGVCIGALALDENDDLVGIAAGAVVLATGGGTRIFQRNLNPGDVTGDGCAMAYEAGAQLVNMEFMQAGIGFIKPFVSLFNSYLWAGLPNILNGSGEQFIQNYLPGAISSGDAMKAHCAHFPFSSVDSSKYIEISISQEIASGKGTQNGGVCISLAGYTPSYVKKMSENSGLEQMWPMVQKHFCERGVDIVNVPAEICCFAHALNGGVRIDEHSMSSLPGLFAAGETAGGPHGADRLGGNMLLTCQVFGELAGRGAARFARKNGGVRPENAYFVQQAQPVKESLMIEADAAALLCSLQCSNQHNLLVCRTQAGLEQLQGQVKQIGSELAMASRGARIRRNSLELAHQVLLTQLMCSAALRRRESRGSHYRADYPEKDDRQFNEPYIQEKASRGRVHGW